MIKIKNLLSRASGAGDISGTNDKCRVMIVDDSSVVRGMLARIIEAEPGFRVISSVPNGKQAIDALRRDSVDVILLDIEMPEMDGITALPELKKIDPSVQIIMVSALTHRNAEVSLRALAAGATDYIAKPTTSRDITLGSDFNRELISKLLSLSEVARRISSCGKSNVKSSDTPSFSAIMAEKKKVVLRKNNIDCPKVVAIGSSTGGPQALFKVIKEMGNDLPQPVLIVQHMPVTFTAILAEHISRQCNVDCSEAVDGKLVESGKYYVAAGDFHMLAEKRDKSVFLNLTNDPPENFCRPAVDPLLRSLAKIYGSGVLAVILTGMGQDGMRGCDSIVKSGGSVIAQDEATSIVWGMPGAVATAGLCSKILPIDEIGYYVRKIATRSA